MTEERLDPQPPTPSVPAGAAPWFDISQLYSSRLQTEELISLVARNLGDTLRAECAFFWDAGLEEGFKPRAWYSPDPERQRHLDTVLSLMLRPLASASATRAMREGRSVFAPVLALYEPPLDPIWTALGAHSFMAAPVWVNNTMLGLFAAFRGPELPEAFTPADLAALEEYVPGAGRVLANATLLAEERWQRQKAELMFQASKAIHAEPSFGQAVGEIALLLKQAIRSPWVGFFGLNASETGPASLTLLASSSDPGVDLALARTPIALEDWAEARELFQARGGDRPLTLPAWLAAAIGHPPGNWRAFLLEHQLGPQGMLVLTASPGPELSAEATEVATGIAELVALAIMSQHLIERDARARSQIIRSQAAAQEREVLLRQIVHDLRNATQAMSLVVEDLAIEIGELPAAQAGLATLDSQITFVSNFLKEKLRWIQHGDRARGSASLTEVFSALQARYLPVARAKQQRLVVLNPEDVQVALSAVELEQILGNLLDNAIKYTQPQGEVRLRADHADGWVTLYVSDTGPGIPPAMQDRLGEVGYRGEAVGEGAGLGLSNVRQLVTQAGGLFGFTSREQLGTTFHVSLPTTLWGKVTP